MPLQYHPLRGTIVICDFRKGFEAPEMVKRRPALVISPQIRARPGLCTVVALSTTPPKPRMNYHCELRPPVPLPEPFDSERMWVKGDMVAAVAFRRVDLVRTGRDEAGRRTYLKRPISGSELAKVERCILYGMGLGRLTRHL